MKDEVKKKKPRRRKKKKKPQAQPDQAPPINPFTDSSLPTRDHEDRFKEEAMEPADQGDNPFEPGNLPDEVKKEEEGPINPFEPKLKSLKI